MTAVYKAISKVQAGIAKEGISKDQKNQQQGYKFRGIDDIFNALSPLLADAGLCILPNVKGREITERTNKAGTSLFFVVVHVDYDFVCAEDGSKHTVTVYGEAMDSGDKATNKAMSAAYKYACLQAFCIPTEGDNDADATTHEVAPKQPVTPQQQKIDAMKQSKTQALIEVGVLPDGTLDYDLFAADIEHAIEKAASMSELTAIKMANGKTLNKMKVDRPEMFNAIVEIFITCTKQYQ